MNQKNVRLKIKKLENQSWEDAFKKNLSALEWAIKNAPFRYVASLIDTKSIVRGLQSKVVKD